MLFERRWVFSFEVFGLQVSANVSLPYLEVTWIRSVEGLRVDHGDMGEAGRPHHGWRRVIWVRPGDRPTVVGGNNCQVC